MIDGGDEDRRIAEQRKRAEQRALEAREHLRELLEIYEFREFYWNTLAETHYFDASFRGEATHTAAFVEGQRDIGAKLFISLLTAAPDVYTLMRAEAQARAELETTTGEPDDDEQD